MFALLQRVGRALMLPVSVLPLAGLLLGVGSSRQDLASHVLARAGGVIFDNLPLLFAIGVALGLTQGCPHSALAAAMAYLIVLHVMGIIGQALGQPLVSVSGVSTLETGVFGGILVGLMVCVLAARRPPARNPSGLLLGASACAVALGVLLSFVWPPIQGVIESVSNAIAYRDPALASACWAVVNRALLPFGLHHLWNTPFFFQVGSYLDGTGKVVHGELSRFVAGDRNAGILAGGFVFGGWGLPAAALAMWTCAPPHRRKQVGGLMASGALTAVLTGITEPIEFAFLFVAPQLYALHAILAGLACWVMVSLGAHIGFTFSFGLIDYFVLYRLHTRPWLVWLVGPVFATLYFVLFRWAILRWDLATPGRERNEELVGQERSPSAGTA